MRHQLPTPKQPNPATASTRFLSYMDLSPKVSRPMRCGREMINAPHRFSFSIRQTNKDIQEHITMYLYTMPLNEPFDVSCLGLLTSTPANGTPITVPYGIFFFFHLVFHKPKEAHFCVYQVPGFCSWRGTSGCSINIASGSKRHMTPKWTFQRRRLRHFTTSHRYPLPPPPPFWHTPLHAPQEGLREEEAAANARHHQSRKSCAPPPPPQSGNRCTSGLEPPVRHTCPSRLHASAGLMHECLPRPPSWWNGQTLGWPAGRRCLWLISFFSSFSSFAAGDRRRTPAHHDRGLQARPLPFCDLRSRAIKGIPQQSKILS
ncbi:hypothetical protein ACQKWADRAFT_298194 [Trichoderma austrokoningii]